MFCVIHSVLGGFLCLKDEVIWLMHQMWGDVYRFEIIACKVANTFQLNNSVQGHILHWTGGEIVSKWWKHVMRRIFIIFEGHTETNSWNFIWPLSKTFYSCSPRSSKNSRFGESFSTWNFWWETLTNLQAMKSSYQSPVWSNS